MDCRECNELLPLYLDTSLSPKEMQDIKQHLDICRPCHEEFGKLSDTLELVCKMEKVSPPADFHTRFMCRFNKECKPKKAWNWWGTLSLSTVAAAAMVLLVVVLYNPLNNENLAVPQISDQAPAKQDAPVAAQAKKSAQPASRPATASELKLAEGPADDEIGALAQAPSAPRAETARPRRRSKSLVTSVSMSDYAGGASASRSAGLSGDALASKAKRAEAPVYRQAGEWSGSESTVRAPRNQVVRNESELQALWQTAGIKSIPKPQVDWRRQMLGAIFLGDQPGQGHEIRLHEIQRTVTGQTVKYHVESPVTVTGASSRPFFIFLMPLSRQPVQFQSE